MPEKLSELRDKYLDWIRGFRRPRTAENYQRYLDRFIKENGDRPVADLRAFDLLSWGKTWHQIQALQRFLSWACNDAELIPRNPFARIKKPPLGKRRRLVDQATLARILRGSRPEFRAFLLTLRETLCRPQEARSFAWEHVRFLGYQKGGPAALVAGLGVLVLEEHKASDRRADPLAPRVIPISRRLGRLLVRLLRREPGPGPILRNSQGGAWTNNAIRCRMRALRRRLGLAKDSRGENIVPYTLRHTYATIATAAGIRDRKLADLMGHTCTRTTARYQHLEADDLAAALEAIQRAAREFGRKEGSTGIVGMEQLFPAQGPLHHDE